MNLDLKHICRSGTTARAVSINGPAKAVLFRTSDGFCFYIPIVEMNDEFPGAGKAIEYLRWIRKAVATLKAQDLEAEEAVIRERGL